MHAFLSLWLLATPGGASLKIAVFDVSGKVGMDQDHATMFADLLESELSGRGYSVISRGDIEAMLGIEKMKDALACNAQSCLAELGGALGVDDLLTGTIGKLGKYLVITLKRISPARGRVLKEVSRQIADGGDEQLVESIPSLIDELYGGGKAGTVVKAKPVVDASACTVRFVIDDPERNETSIDVYFDEQVYHCPAKVKMDQPCTLTLPAGPARIVFNGKRAASFTVTTGLTIYHLDHNDDDLGFWSVIIGGAAVIAGGAVVLAAIKDSDGPDKTTSLTAGGVIGGLGLALGAIGGGVGYSRSGDRESAERVSSKKIGVRLAPLPGRGFLAGLGVSF